MFTFCKPVSSKKRFSPHRRLNDVFTFTLFENADRVIRTEWEAVTKKKSVFLERDYLKLVETCSGSKLKCRYVVVYENAVPVGIIYFQIIDFSAGIFGDLLSNQVESIKSKRLSLFEKYIDANRDEVLMRLFTCGNNLVSGEYGFIFSGHIDGTLANEILLQIVELISKEEKLRGSISAVLLKDFHSKLKPEKLLEEEKYTDFFVEPNMVVDIPSNVNSLGDYIALFSKKYRNRAKSILKTGAALERKNLSLEEVKKYESEIYALYESVYEKAKFKLLKLPANYFSRLKELFSSDFIVTGFFLEGKLLAFSSSILMPDKSLEAHYIGLDYSLNQEYDLYQNILYCNIDLAIQNRKAKVNLGRTAAEIKTTVGAKAVDLICYVKPQNTLSRLIMNPFISFLQPGEWTARNPFKEEN
jgi:hypothetical protein